MFFCWIRDGGNQFFLWGGMNLSAGKAGGRGRGGCVHWQKENRPAELSFVSITVPRRFKGSVRCPACRAAIMCVLPSVGTAEIGRVQHLHLIV